MHLARHLMSCPVKLAVEREAHLNPIVPVPRENGGESEDAGNSPFPSPVSVNPQDDTTSPIKPFDFSFEITKHLTLCNQGRGMPDKDIQGFIDVYNIARQHDPNMPPLEFKTLGEFIKYRQGFVIADEGGMKTIMIDITEEDVPGLSSPLQFPFAMKDIVTWLEEEFRRPEYKVEVEGFRTQYTSSLIMNAAPVYKEMPDGSRQRVITTPETADTWIQLQDKLRMHSVSREGCVAAVQLYSDKTLVNHKGMSCHPVKAALFNVPYSKRIKGILSDASTVAYFQDLTMPEHVKGVQQRLVKLVYMSKALKALLGPLKAASFEGLKVKDPLGSWMVVYPRLLSYVMDLPESKDVFMVKGMPSSNPCEACMVTKDDLHNIFKGGIESRTVEHQKKRYNDLISEPSNAKRMKLATSLSTQPVPCALFGFADQEDDDACSVMQVLAHESLHNDDIGVFLYLLDYMDAYFDGMDWTASRKNKAYQKMNQRLESMPRAGMFTYVVFICIY
jgi:hypothetical protein